MLTEISIKVVFVRDDFGRQDANRNSKTIESRVGEYFGLEFQGRITLVRSAKFQEGVAHRSILSRATACIWQRLSASMANLAPVSLPDRPRERTRPKQRGT